jgi:hypothetical protein
LGDEEIRYKQRSRSNSKDGGSNSTSDQDKTKKMFSPEEILKLPAGTCVFINPAYANQKEASIPMKLKVLVGEGELKRRAYGEAKFDLVIQQLKKKIQHSQITGNDIKIRTVALDKFIPGKYTKSLKDICFDASKELVRNNDLFAKKVKNTIG